MPMSDEPQRDKENAQGRCHRKLVEGLLLISADERPAAIIDALKEVNRLSRAGEPRRPSRR
jgi:hypothetical protein